MTAVVTGGDDLRASVTAVLKAADRWTDRLASHPSEEPSGTAGLIA
jgi:hypothetical protein